MARVKVDWGAIRDEAIDQSIFFWSLSNTHIGHTGVGGQGVAVLFHYRSAFVTGLGDDVQQVKFRHFFYKTPT